MRGREHILNEKHAIHLLDDIKEACSSPWMPKNLLFDIYLNILGLQQNPQEERRFKELRIHFPAVIPQIARKKNKLYPKGG